MGSKLTYETAITELEKIVKMLEDGKLPLDKSLELFEKGTSLANFCNKSLDAAEKKIVQLTEVENADKSDEGGTEEDDELEF